MAHEAAVLRALGAAAGALWIADGRTAGRDWMLQRWIEGRAAHRVAAELRESTPTTSRAALADLYAAACTSVEAVHAAGYLHGDIQPMHLCVDRNGRVHLLDFGQAHRIGEDIDYRGALVHFMASEICAQVLVQGHASLTTAAEVYSMAATLFFLHTGEIAADYGAIAPRAEEGDGGREGSNPDVQAPDPRRLPFEVKLRCIAQGHRRDFAAVGARPDADIEALLAAGLAMSPEDRPATMEAYAEAWGRLVSG